MSEAEFDSYLSLLSKFLRLRARQRGELADELRDHLDSRLEELLAAGKTREEAVAVALEEFGDAAVLATEFSRLASRRTRRFVMRCTAASAAVVAAVILLSVSLAPPGPNGLGPDFVAAQPGAEGGGAPGGLPGMAGVPAAPDKTSIEQVAIAALDEKLGKAVTAEFGGPLRKALEQIADSIEADLILDEIALTDAGVNVDDPVTLKLTRTSVSARTVLGFVLEPYDLTFVNRSGVLFVTTAELAEELLVTKVYNVRDLLENAQSHPYGAGMMGGYGGMEGGGTGGGLGGGMGGSGFFSIADRYAAMMGAVGQVGGGDEGSAGGDAAMSGMAGMMGSGGGGMGGRAKPSFPEGPVGDLMATIQTTTSGPWFDVDGVGGTITVFNGLLVVRQTEQIHGEIRKLLEALREAGRQQPGGVATVPNGPPAPAGYDPNFDPSTPAATNDATTAAPPRMTRGEFERFVAGMEVSDAVREAFTREFAASGGRRSLGQVGLFWRLSFKEDGLIHAAFRALNLDPGTVVDNAAGSGIAGDIASPQALYDQARVEAKRLGGSEVEARHVMLALLSGGYTAVEDFVRTLDVTPDELREQLSADRTKAPAGEPASPSPALAILPGGGQPGPPTVPAPQGLGERFADYRPTPQMRKMFLRAFGTVGVGPGEIGEVGLLQILLQNSGPAIAVFEDAGIGTEQVQEAFNPTRIDRPIGDLYAFLDAAQAAAKKDGLDTIDTGHLLVVLLDKGKDGPLRDILARMGISAEEVKRWLNEHRKTTPADQRNPLQESPAPPREISSLDRLGLKIGFTSKAEATEANKRKGFGTGLKVAWVEQDSAAAQARIRPNDLLVSLNHIPVDGARQVDQAIEEARSAGRSTVPFITLTEGQPRTGSLSISSIGE